MSRRLLVVTAGCRVDVDDRTGRHVPALARAAGLVPEVEKIPDGSTGTGPVPATPAVRVVLEQGRHPFRIPDAVTITRGVTAGDGAVVLDSAGGSGFSQRWEAREDHVTIRCRWAPNGLERAASAVRSRHDALRAQTLLHYPALWWAGTLGLAPLHMSVLDLDGVVVALVGPGGVGKSTLVAQALATGARATCDNVAASDGTTAFGLRESLRLADAPVSGALPGSGAPAPGRRTTHGRRESAWAGQVPALRPDIVVVVRRGDGPKLRPLDPGQAQRVLVARTYAAGELRRFWGLTSVLGLATGRGPVLPAVEEVARRLTHRAPCFDLELGRHPGLSLAGVLARQLDEARTAKVVSR